MYRAPVSEISHTLMKVAGLEKALDDNRFPEFSADLAAAILEEAGKFANQRIAPLNRVIRYMGKDELARIAAMRRLTDAIGFFPVRRGAGDRVALHIGEEVLRRGDSLGIFPEGTRVYEGRLARPKQGAARLALVTGVPIVPVAIYGNRWSESLFKVTVAFGRPHTFEGVRATPANIRRATEEAWADVLELWEAMRADRLF